MSCLDLNTTSIEKLQQQLSHHRIVVACLCAAWCDVCTRYRTEFDAFAAQHAEWLFLWIDIEDQADLVGNFEVEDFPTLLIQQHGLVTFYGTMQPDTTQLKRLLQSQTKQSLEQLQTQTTTNEHQRRWQSEANLIQQLTQQQMPQTNLKGS